ncbi:MAG TPA: BrnA antitoxin family protein [Alphaproteobacteria bacterium]|nr:BrnA antitoxin family protein [Alphaproteobacteria bacterium]
MPKRNKGRRYADDAPLTDAELKTARRLRAASPALAGAVKRSRGRPHGRTKETLHISLDAEIAASLRKSGKGWQTRLNDMLRAAVHLME